MSDVKNRLLGLFKTRSSHDRPETGASNETERRHRRERPNNSHTPHRKPDKERHSRSPQSKSAPRKSTGSQPSPPSSSTGRASRRALTEWPVSGSSPDESMTQGKAMELITPGAPVFKGCRRQIPHVSDKYYNLYASCGGNGGAGSDCGDPFTDAFTLDSFPIHGSESVLEPWDTLEQPSMAFCYGLRPGEITLNHWVGLSRRSNPPIELRDPGFQPRDVSLSTILERLQYLQTGFEEDYEDLMYKNLYSNLLRDPDKYLSPHKGMEKQIADLIIVLSRPRWIDFSKLENQVVAKFFANASYTDRGRYKTFFHQLLLCTELNLRIHSKYHTEYAKEKLLSQLPPSIAWGLALASRWKESVRIEKFDVGEESKQIQFHLQCKKKQVKALRKFARAMKWPNLVQVDKVLKEQDAEATPLEDRSSDTMSYFTGMILPGVTLPWLIMNSLIDCDNDAGVNSLAALTHMYPICGFQYKSTTYWSSSSIVGKVLAPTCREIAGWIGPARPAPDLGRTQIARIRQRKPKHQLTPSDVDSMAERSDPMGPPSDRYLVSEYELLLPDTDPDSIVDTIRIEMLALKAVSNSASAADLDTSKPLLYDAAVQFAIAGESWPLRLSYDVSFISACPCSRGPHPLFFDYIYKCVKVDDLLTIRHWGDPHANANTSSVGASSGVGSSKAKAAASTSASPPPRRAEDADEDDDDDEGNEAEKVLVVSAFGVSDNEVLARAWCAHWALGAVIADVERTCMSCAIREAYAACLNVVILIEGSRDGEDV